MLDEAESWTSPYDVMSLGILGAGRAVVAVRRGDHSEAVRQAQACVTHIDRGEQPWTQADIRRWVSEVWRAVGDTDTERKVIAEALDLYDSKEITRWRAALRLA